LPRNSGIYTPTFALIAANVGVYAFTSILSGSLTTNYTIEQAFGQVNSSIWRGETWRLLTAMFIHADITHIFGNMLFLLIFGLRAEDMFDIEEYLAVYFLTGIAGGLLTLLLGPPDIPSIGASGAIFGVLGATLVYARRSIGQSIFGALIYAFFLFFINVGPGVNILAHLGGLGAGLLIGYVLAVLRRPRSVTHRYKYPDSWGKAGYVFQPRTHRGKMQFFSGRSTDTA
jgi:rhomboid protease GluP